MKKLLLSLTLAVGVIVCSVGCSKTKLGSSNDSEAMKTVETAFNNLKNMDKMYEISNVMQAPDGNLCYVEICNNGGSYVEYSVDKDGNYGTVAFQNAQNTDYVLTDWISSNNKGYMLSADNKWVSYPDTYTQDLSSRRYMYFDKMIDKLKDLKFKETTTADIGMGDEKIDVYTATLDSETVHLILGLGSEQIYKCIKDETKDKNIEKLCEYYLDNIGFTMVFSDANLNIGVVDNVLRYIQIEVGGLGTRLYFTKSVLTKEVDLRDEPDFSSVSTYESTMKEMADYVAKYDTYEEAMKALGKSDSETSVSKPESSSPSPETTSEPEDTNVEDTDSE